MADRAAKRLGRLHRVRSLQVTLTRAEESAAHARLASETALRTRVAELADSVAPRPSPTPAEARSLMADAHFRERLHQTAQAAQQRVAVAEQGVSRAQLATREARRDQSAIEKLLDRARTEAVLKELKALEDAPPVRRNRHGPC